MDIKYFLIIIIIYILYNFMTIEKFEDKTELIDLYNKTECDGVITVTESHRNPTFNMVLKCHYNICL